MKFVGGNRAIRDHLMDGKALQVFEQDKKDKRFLRHLGEMEYARWNTPSTLTVRLRTLMANSARAIVFHLRPVGTLAPDSAVVAAALAGEGPVSKHGGSGFGSVETNRRVETVAIEFVTHRYEEDGWTVRSVEAQKARYDLRCDRGNEQAHIEVKGTQGSDVCFIITAAEVRNAMIDRRHVTWVVTAALTAAPKIITYTRDDFAKNIQLDPIAFRAQLLST
jgi:uncharacterized protein DUF3883